MCCLGQVALLAKVCCLAGLILLVVLFQEIVSHQRYWLTLYIMLICTGSWRLSLPPTSLTLVTLISLLTLATVVAEELVDDAVLVTCTGMSTALFQFSERPRLAYMWLMSPEMLNSWCTDT